ncbi:hypothetical protein HG537_0D01460 [Torulaspora globosa]|uniref:Transcriptional coactivator p15 (PC4) C-terminal domain-containing protein n=1 Tax=Torulaspora globosa TaxID=48254 RepID=A0A7H9HUN6_9SACH|nr:hypothetical protein HG537_0D01460 [Torulaspora sp. CBS 2947]
MSYYNRYRNRKKFDGSGPSSSNGGGSGGLAAADAVFDLGKNKRVTVRQFRNVNLIDIREYYMDTSTGEMKPGKKGISLTEDLYDELLKHRLNIDEALRRFGSKRPRTKTVRLLSDDEDEHDVKEAESSTTGHDDDSLSSNKRKKPAPPTLLPQEEKRQNDEREANAPLVVPGLAKKRQQAPDNVQPRLKQDDDEAENASDEEFVQNLEAEMNRPDDEVSEEE